jgi:hypothetical protein
MMAQGLLPFQYKVENSESGLTSFAGLPLYIELGMTTGLCQKIKQVLQIKSRGWTDLQIIMSLILLNLVGGDCVDDIERLELDEGMRTLLLKIETHGMRRKERREYERRWRKSKQRAFPSASAIRRFYHAAEERLREAGKAFIPAPNMHKLSEERVYVGKHLSLWTRQEGCITKCHGRQLDLGNPTVQDGSGGHRRRGYKFGGETPYGDLDPEAE